MIVTALALHVLAALIWVGGMIFSHFVLRPAVVDLEREARLALWRQVLPHFFRLVWGSIILLLVTGYFIVFEYFGGFAGVGLSVHLMQGLAFLMILLFTYVYTVPFSAFTSAMDDGDHDQAALHFARIRLIISLNLPLGVICALIGATGRYWG